MSRKPFSLLYLALAAVLFLVGCEEASIPTRVEDAGAGQARSGGAASIGAPGAAVDGRYIVVLKDEALPAVAGARKARAAEVARGLGLSPLHTYGTALFGFAAVVPEGRLRALARDPRVAYVNADAPVHLPNPVHADAPPWQRGGGGGSAAQVIPWGVRRIGADANTNTGAGVDVYVLDTGIDSDHPDLQAHLSTDGYAAVSCKGGDCTYAWDDDHDHGTHVAGTIGALDNDVDVVGVAPGVTLHAVKVLDRRGSGSWSGIIDGIDWVAARVAASGRAAVANMSLGGSGSKAGTCTSGGFTGGDAMHAALCNAARAGVVFAVAAGNDGVDAATQVPAAYDDAVITVSATREGDDWPYWSNWGDAPAGWTSAASAPVVLAAPGVDILSTKRGGGTTTMSGTSMASPHTAGALALYLAGTGPAAGYGAFTGARSALLSGAEPTGSFSNTSGRPHAEPFLDGTSL